MARNLIFLVLLLICGAAYSEILLKKLAGPPSEFKYFAPLNSLDYPEVQHSAIFKVDLAPDEFHNDVLTQQVKLLVDSHYEFKIIFFSPYSSDIHLSLNDPEGKHVSLQGIPTFVPVGDAQAPGTAYTITYPKRGEYVLTLTTNRLSESVYRAITSNSQEDVYIILWNEDAMAMHTTLNTYAHVTGNKIGLITKLVDVKGKSRVQIKSGLNVEAEMQVILPNGDIINKPMLDDGLHSDMAGDDGIYGSLITASIPGFYSFSATINGTNSNGYPYVRTTEKLIQVIDDNLDLSGAAFGIMDSPVPRMTINLGVSAPIGQQYYVYSEVWGMSENNNQVPVAWIGGMAFVQDSNNGNILSLELDLNWLSMANAQEPLLLKNVVVKDPNAFIVVSEAVEVSVKTIDSIQLRMSKYELKTKNDEITTEMREGILPPMNITTGSGGIVLVHGYCSGDNPFQSNPSGTWTNAKYFLQANQNMPNDQFAKSILNFAGTSPYSCVGHSQGGMAILHLKNFYTSGMDYVSGGRTLQSVGTPYKGCSAAGNAANLGSLFGISCGKNIDLTTDGAIKWLSTIAPANKARVYYYTTTYEQGKAFGDYCNLAMNTILQFPNDGTTEIDYSVPDGGQHMGNVQKWCHVPSMKYAAQCTNIDRNKVMNSNAAR